MERTSELTGEIAAMEEAIRKRIKEIERHQPDHLYQKLEMEFYSWNYEEKSVTIRYPVLDWELNHMGSMHGGMVAAAIDTTSGIATSHFAKHNITTTVSLNINYLLPALAGDAMLVTAKIDHLGKRLVNVTVTCRSEKSGKIIATATVNFMLT